MRVLLDTNVLVSILLKPPEGSPVRELFFAFTAGRFTLLMPEWLLDELRETVQTKPRISKRVSIQELHQLTTLILTLAERIAAIEGPIPPVTRDPDDDYVLAYALVGAADYLVTGDKRLLTLQDLIDGLEIVTPVQFVEIIRE